MDFMKKIFISIFAFFSLFATGIQAGVTVSGIEDMFQPVIYQVPSKAEFPLTPELFAEQKYEDSDIEFKFNASADVTSQVYIEVCYCAAKNFLRNGGDTQENNVQIVTLLPDPKNPGIRTAKYKNDAKVTKKDVTERAQLRSTESRDCIV